MLPSASRWRRRDWATTIRLTSSRVDALVGRVDAGDRDVLGPPEHELGSGRGLLERAQQRDGSPAARLAGGFAEGARRARRARRRTPGRRSRRGTAGPPSCACTSTWAPHGACASRCATSASSSWLGLGSRDDAHRDLRAGLGNEHVGRRRDGGHVDADGVDRGLGPQQVADLAAARERHAVQDVRAGAEVLRAEVGTLPAARATPGDRDVALVVVQRREEPGERHHGIGCRAAEDPECSGCSSVRTVTMQATSPRSAVVRAGSPTLQVAHVADDEQVAGEQLGVRLDERLEVALRLLHALEDQLDGARRCPSKTRIVPEVGDEAADVVGGPAAVDPPVVLAGGGQRVGRPALLGRGGLHVVVGVQHDDRRARGPCDLPVDRRVAGRHLHEPRVREAGVAEHLQRPLPICLHRLARVPREGDRRDRDELLEVLDDPRHQRADLLGDLLLLHGAVLPVGGGRRSAAPAWLRRRGRRSARRPRPSSPTARAWG